MNTYYFMFLTISIKSSVFICTFKYLCLNLHMYSFIGVFMCMFTSMYVYINKPLYEST